MPVTVMDVGHVWVVVKQRLVCMLMTMRLVRRSWFMGMLVVYIMNVLGKIVIQSPAHTCPRDHEPTGQGAGHTVGGVLGGRRSRAEQGCAQRYRQERKCPTTPEVFAKQQDGEPHGERRFQRQ